MLLQASAADAYSSLVKDGIDLKFVSIFRSFFIHVRCHLSVLWMFLISFTSDSARSHSGRLNLRLRCVVSARIPVLSNFANS
ncbi:Protein of unknown function [Gryllus bimaculatus]|nr:Protein of unknown function [Gryllus bimaculatus]